MYKIAIATGIAIHYSLPSCLVRFPYGYACIPFSSSRCLCKALAVQTRKCRLLYHGWLLEQESSARSRIERCCNGSWASSHNVPRILHWLLTEEVEKGQILWVHTYPTTSLRRRGRRVQNSAEIGSEIWICIRCKKQTNKKQTKTNKKPFYLYI